MALIGTKPLSHKLTVFELLPILLAVSFKDKPALTLAALKVIVFVT